MAKGCRRRSCARSARMRLKLGQTVCRWNPQTAPRCRRARLWSFPRNRCCIMRRRSTWLHRRLCCPVQILTAVPDRSQVSFTDSPRPRRPLFPGRSIGRHLLPSLWKAAKVRRRSRRLCAGLTILKSSPAPSQTATENVRLVQVKAAKAKRRRFRAKFSAGVPMFVGFAPIDGGRIERFIPGRE